MGGQMIEFRGGTEFIRRHNLLAFHDECFSTHSLFCIWPQDALHTYCAIDCYPLCSNDGDLGQNWRHEHDLDALVAGVFLGLAYAIERVRFVGSAIATFKGVWT